LNYQLDHLLCRRHLYFTAKVMTLCSIEFITDVMLFKDNIEELNIIAFYLQKTMHELFLSLFLSEYPSSLLCLIKGYVLRDEQVLEQ
jgi:hypothetical protein